ncbi:mucin-4-like [Ptychodera flava]|uniref:mucin-4-like n=1 Tax=Ptychodera flava TaxID=63121 RepID=UPI00396A8468
MSTEKETTTAIVSSRGYQDGTTDATTDAFAETTIETEAIELSSTQTYTTIQTTQRPSTDISTTESIAASTDFATTRAADITTAEEDVTTPEIISTEFSIAIDQSTAASQTQQKSTPTLEIATTSLQSTQEEEETLSRTATVTETATSTISTKEILTSTETDTLEPTDVTSASQSTTSFEGSSTYESQFMSTEKETTTAIVSSTAHKDATTDATTDTFAETTIETEAIELSSTQTYTTIQTTQRPSTDISTTESIAASTDFATTRAADITTAEEDVTTPEIISTEFSIAIDQSTAASQTQQKSTPTLEIATTSLQSTQEEEETLSRTATVTETATPRIEIATTSLQSTQEEEETLSRTATVTETATSTISTQEILTSTETDTLEPTDVTSASQSTTSFEGSSTYESQFMSTEKETTTAIVSSRAYQDATTDAKTDAFAETTIETEAIELSSTQTYTTIQTTQRPSTDISTTESIAASTDFATTRAADITTAEEDVTTPEIISTEFSTAIDQSTAASQTQQKSTPTLEIVTTSLQSTQEEEETLSRTATVTETATSTISTKEILTSTETDTLEPTDVTSATQSTTSFEGSSTFESQFMSTEKETTTAIVSSIAHKDATTDATTDAFAETTIETEAIELSSTQTYTTIQTTQRPSTDISTTESIAASTDFATTRAADITTAEEDVTTPEIISTEFSTAIDQSTAASQTQQKSTPTLEIATTSLQSTQEEEETLSRTATVTETATSTISTQEILTSTKTDILEPTDVTSVSQSTTSMEARSTYESHFMSTEEETTTASVSSTALKDASFDATTDTFAETTIVTEAIELSSTQTYTTIQTTQKPSTHIASTESIAASTDFATTRGAEFTTSAKSVHSPESTATVDLRETSSRVFEITTTTVQTKREEHETLSKITTQEIVSSTLADTAEPRKVTYGSHSTALHGESSTYKSDLMSTEEETTAIFVVSSTRVEDATAEATTVALAATTHKTETTDLSATKRTEGESTASFVFSTDVEDDANYSKTTASAITPLTISSGTATQELTGTYTDDTDLSSPVLQTTSFVSQEEITTDYNTDSSDTTTEYRTDSYCSPDTCGDGCANSGACLNCGNGPFCHCPDNYHGITCEEDVNECNSTINGCSQFCENTYGSYVCSCRDGFILNNDGRTCRVLVPCTKQCFKGACNVNNGQQECHCDDGYQLHPIRDALCIDIDECQDGGLCDQSCQNLPGTYQCQCQSGYMLNTTDQTTCYEINECESSPCVFGFCEDIVNGFVCICDDGFTGITCDTELNECESQPCIYGTCNDAINAYNCSCFGGYTGVNCNTEINECEIDPCLYGNCVDMIDMYRCECIPGWTGVTCDQDVDECASSLLNDCHQICVNVNTTVHEDGYMCLCNDGYELLANDVTCSDINECKSEPCLNGGTCKDYINGYQCLCTDGWKGLNCEEDIDECIEGVAKCDINANCTNTPGDYNCTCNDGYRGNGFVCKEIIMLPFGPQYGDADLRGTKEERRSLGMLDLVSPTINPPIGFPFWGEFYYSLYFTDNGVIVFIKENGDKYPFPYPYPNGFNTDQDIPMVAVFWDDVDLGLANFGEVYYKEYDTSTVLSDEDSAIVKDVNRRIRSQYPNVDEPDSNFASFQATWILKITWYQVPPFFAEYTKHSPNTFQGILATDGKYGFVLINFMEDEMRWIYSVRGYTSLNRAIIGYNGGQGRESEIENAQFTFGSVEDLYRPDQFDGNTGLKGRFIYRVEDNSDSTFNAKQQCLEWYNQQPDPSDWNDDLGFCPCGFSQGRNDASFGRGGRGNDVLTNGLLRNGNVQGVDSQLLRIINLLRGQGFCLQTSFSNVFGAGQRCCYRDDHSFIDGYETLWESSYMERYQWINKAGLFDYTSYLQWIDQDILPRYFCCNASNDPAFCDMYEEKRPRGSCTGYKPPKIGFMFGDPHITTLDNATYTFNGLGEYILVEVGDAVFTLQARTSRFVTSSGGLSNATIFTAFVARQNASSIVEFTMNENATDYSILVDGTPFNTSLLSEDLLSSDEFIDVQFYLKVEIPSNVTRTIAVFSSGIGVSVGISQGMLDAAFIAPDSFKNKTRGLLGVWNDDPADDFLRRDGTYQQPSQIGQNLTEVDYFDFGQTWKVQEAESLFNYSDNTSWDTYNENDFVPAFFDEVRESSSESIIQIAEEVCEGNLQCLYDTLTTKNPTVGEATKVTSDQLQIDSEDLANYPPTIFANTVINASVGEPVVVEVFATDVEGSPIDYSLKTPIPYNATMYSNGTFVWTPTSLDSVLIGYVASDGQIQSTFVPEVRLCHCQNNGTCNYAEFIDGSDVVDDKFAVVPCDCPLAYTGDFCEEDYEGCLDEPCYPGVLCFDNIAPEDGVRCGPCPPGLVGTGFKCYDFDECYEGQDFHNGSICDQICTNTYESFECSCYTGYTLHPDGISCIDIDECYINIDDCDPRAVCTNTDGGFYCTCNHGYNDANGDGTLCENIDECVEAPPCDDDAECQDTIGSFICTCNDGYEGSGFVCTDIDECATFVDDCDIHASCTNVIGSFTCQCDSGWAGNGTHCTNFNECDDVNTNACHPRATCNDVIGSYSCTCNIGYAGDGLICEDCDECENGHDGCVENVAACINAQGSYYCECLPGYTGNGFNCSDINECEIGTSTCSQYADCVNTIGSYMCECIEGYAGNGIVCNDIDECRTPWKVDCNTNIGNCLNTLGGYECQCIAGYQGDGINCTDINECATNDGNCDHPLCTNLQGGYQCSCNAGYLLDNDGITCNDIDECYLNTANCSQGCNNTIGGGYSCYCYNGFQEDSNGCQPLEKCKNLTCENAWCYVMNGEELCRCNGGYKFLNGSSSVCIDIDESVDPDYPHRCQQIVTNTVPGYTCSCYTGFKLSSDQRSCQDIDECREETDDCKSDEHEVCTNVYGGYQCVCDTGYENTTGVCQDINECLNGDHGCSSDAVCNNTVGSYFCECAEGYTGDGFTCEDVNECNHPSPCDDNAKCQNTIGSYNCSCKDGYRLHELLCEDINECLEGSDNCHSEANCTNTVGSFICMCNPGFQGDGMLCFDVDECNVDINDPRRADCDVIATCNNTVGGYHCECPIGFHGNGSFCADNDECASRDTNTCSNESVCQNIDFSYTCNCLSGYRSISRDECVDVDECQENPTICDENAKCRNAPGTYSCSCVQGFTGNGTYCVDVDECSSPDYNNCDPVAECTNYVGAYSCQCPSGYLTVNNSAGRICQDFDECLHGTDECDSEAGICTNTDGRYYCECKDGYQGDGFTCSDVDECTTKPCDLETNQRCRNIPGNFTCECLSGYFRQDSLCKEVTALEASVIYIGINGLEWTYTEDLSYSGTTQYQSYADIVEYDLDYLFENSSIADAYLGSRVIRMDDASNRVLVTFLIDLVPQSNVTAKDIESAFEAGLTGRYSNIISGDDYVVAGSFQVILPVNNPCFDQTYNCDERASCVFVSDGNYTCECNDGWVLDSSSGSCQDIDECAESTNICNDTLQQCVNTYGSYECQCQPGYFNASQTNATCSYARAFSLEFTILEINDIEAVFKEEMADTTSSEYSRLGNKIKETLRYVFLRSPITKQDYYGVGNLQFEDGSIVVRLVSYHSEVSTYGADILTAILLSFEDTYGEIKITSGSLSLVIQSASVLFQDYNECADADSNDCSVNATCLNTNGSFTCQCNEQFIDTSESKPGRVCEGICPDNYCMNGGTCLGNTLQTIYCKCLPGYSGDRCNVTVIETTTADEDLDTTEKDDDILDVVAIVVGTTAAVLCAALTVGLAFYCKYRYKRRKQQRDERRLRGPLMYRNRGAYGGYSMWHLTETGYREIPSMIESSLPILGRIAPQAQKESRAP